MIAVSAASGRLGLATLAAIARCHPGVGRVAIARRPEQLAGTPGVEVRAGDYAAVDSMLTALRGVDALVLISAPVRPGTDRLALHRNAIEAARRAGVRTVLYTSVIGNGAEMQTGFAPTQAVNRETESALQASGLRWIVARNGFYLDIDVDLMRAAAAAGGVYESCAGEGRCGYISIAELAAATAALITRADAANRSYNLVGESITVPALTQRVAALLGLELRHRDIGVAGKLASLRAESRIQARGGEAIAQMLGGVQHGQRLGAFDVPSDFEAAAGRPCASIDDMLRQVTAR